MTDFIRFPHTPHLAWLADREPRADKVMSRAEADAFLAGPVVVEEKVDGANLGFSFDEDGELRIQNRGGHIVPPFAGQFSRLGDWLALNQDRLFDALDIRLILFGEWCAATHSLDYDRLPDWFLGFDVYDRDVGRFWSTGHRDDLLRELGLATVPRVAHGRFTLEQLIRRLGEAPSRFRDGPLEGFYLRRDSGDFLHARAKLVRAEFNQAIDEHWRQRAIQWNRRFFG